ncbi:MAG: ABC transporter substrate-binding protein [Gammaproteobacteria bacterium]
MMKHYLASALAVLLFWSMAAVQATGEPATIVQSTTERVLERVAEDKSALREDPGRMYNLVSELIFPHFDFSIMSQWVLGDYWGGADEARREAFVEQFRKLLVRTYATALLEFSGQQISYPPIDQKGGKNTALVKQEISQPGGSSIPIVYRLHNKSGDWKVFDVSVDGVSLVKTYRASFGSMMKNGGLDGLIASLDNKNQQYGN